MTKISSSLPKGQANGLDALASSLVEKPEQPHLVIAVVDCSRITTDVDTGDVEATARIRRIEPISGPDAEKAARLMGRAVEARTGQTVMPLEMEDDIRTLLRGIVDPGTGEVQDGGE